MFPLEPYAGAACFVDVFVCRNSSMRKWRPCTFLLTVRRSPSAPSFTQLLSLSCSKVLCTMQVEFLSAVVHFFTKVVDVPVVLCKVTVAIDTVTSEIDFFISSFTLDNMKKLKNSAFFANTGQFSQRFRLRCLRGLWRREIGQHRGLGGNHDLQERSLLAPRGSGVIAPGGESVVHKLVDAMSSFCGVPG